MTATTLSPGRPSSRTGPPLADEDAKVPDPLVVLEVLSPSIGRRDSITKLGAYFSLPSVRHHLILDTDSATVLHHARRGDGMIEAKALR